METMVLLVEETGTMNMGVGIEIIVTGIMMVQLIMRQKTKDIDVVNKKV
jgi:hypothetical protein